MNMKKNIFFFNRESERLVLIIW